MSTAVATPAKFLFDLDFAIDPEAKPAEPTITLAEHAEKLAQAEGAAYREGFAQAQAETERKAASALEAIGHALEQLGGAIAAIESKLEAEAIEVAVAVARKLAPQLIAREPFAEIAALATECFRQLTTSPHIVVRVNEALHAEARERLDEIARARGFEGRLVVLAEPEIAVGDCRIEWADGGITRSRATAESSVDEAVARYIAARRTALPAECERAKP